MKNVLLALVAAAPLYADCTAPIFPPQTKSMQFVQKNTSEILGESTSTLTWTNRRSTRRRVEWTETFAVEGKQRPADTSEYRCSADGITPIDEGTKFTGVQFPSVLKPGTTWKWSWAGTGISAHYDYRIVKVEEVTVAAGTFQAARIEYTARGESATRGTLEGVKGTIWIAEGVGLIKHDEDDPVFGLLPQRKTLELITREPQSTQRP